MSNPAKTTPEVALFVEELKAFPDKTKEDVVRFFAQEANLISTWYLAVMDRSKSDPIAYMEAYTLTASNTMQEIPFPSQELYAFTIHVMDAFLDGYVNPDELRKLETQSKAATELLADNTDEISNHYDVGPDANGLPRTITDSFYPLELAAVVRKYVNEDGLVVSLSPEKRKLLKALIVDEVSGLERLNRNAPSLK